MEEIFATFKRAIILSFFHRFKLEDLESMKSLSSSSLFAPSKSNIYCSISAWYNIHNSAIKCSSSNTSLTLPKTNLDLSELASLSSGSGNLTTVGILKIVLTLGKRGKLNLQVVPRFLQVRVWWCLLTSPAILPPGVLRLTLINKSEKSCNIWQCSGLGLSSLLTLLNAFLSSEKDILELGILDCLSMKWSRSTHKTPWICPAPRSWNSTR